jgi:hypothetical protein
MADLAHLLDQGLSLDAHYGRRHLASHLNMALLALGEMGAGDAELAAFAETYAKRLRPLAPPRHSIDEGSFAASMGTYVDYPAFLDFFSREAARTSLESVLDTYLPKLERGVLAGGFHGLLRTSYGVETGRRGEILAGLAYWADTFQELPSAPHEGPAQGDPASLLARLRAMSFGQLAPDGLIAHVIGAVAQKEAFQPVLHWLEIDDTTIDSLSRLSAQIYLAAPDFLTLHLVTSAHAVRIVAARLADPKVLLAAYWQAFAGAYLAVGAPALDTRVATSVVAEAHWQPLLAATHSWKNDHDIKLVFAAWRHWQKLRDPIFHEVAARLRAA